MASPHATVPVGSFLAQQGAVNLGQFTGLALGPGMVATPQGSNLALDAAGGSVGTAGQTLHTVHVAKNGDDATADGSVNLPFLTVQAAMQYAWDTYVVPLGPQPTPPFTRPCVFVHAGTYDDGPLVLPPQICLFGEGFNHSRITGNWSIDDRWSNYVPASLPSPPSVLVPNDFRSSFVNVGLFGTFAIDFDATFSNEGKIYALGARFAGDVLITQKKPNPSSNSFTATSCEFLGDVTLSGIPCLFLGSEVRGGTLTLNQATGGGVDNIFESSGGSFANIVINAASGLAPPYTCDFGHATQTGATWAFNGAFIAVRAVASAIPLQALLAFAGGAGQNQISRVNAPNFAGITALRPPAPFAGQQFFDTTLGLPIWWSGTGWINAAGAGV